MNRLPNESLIDFTLRFLTSHSGKPSQQARTPESVTPLRGGPQPICRLLDSSEDIAEVYSRPSSQGQEIYRKDLRTTCLERANHPAPESKSLLCTVLDLHCEVAVDDNQYGILTCKRDAVGICKHCGLPVCLSCVKWGFCCFANHHEVITQ